MCKPGSMVEAAGVERFSVLTACKLLILRVARGAQNAPLPIPLYVYCAKILFQLRLVKRIPKAEYPTVLAF